MGLWEKKSPLHLQVQLATGPGATENARGPSGAAPVGIPPSRLPHPLQVLLRDGLSLAPPPPSRLPSSVPSLCPRGVARPRAPSPRGRQGRPGPPGTFDDAFGGGEVEVPPGHDPLGLLPAPGDRQRAPPSASPAVWASRAPRLFGAAQARGGSGRGSPASNPADRTPAPLADPS